MSRPTFSPQPLEARRFLSVTPMHVEDCPEVVEARTDLQEVTMALRNDRFAGRQAMGAIREARAAGDEGALQEATDKFHADRNALYAELNPLKEQLVEVTKEKGQV